MSVNGQMNKCYVVEPCNPQKKGWSTDNALQHEWLLKTFLEGEARHKKCPEQANPRDKTFQCSPWAGRRGVRNSGVIAHGYRECPKLVGGYNYTTL
jgi:hypothetical protein